MTDLVLKKPTRAPNGTARVCHHGNRGLEKLEDVLLRLPTGQVSNKHTHKCLQRSSMLLKIPSHLLPQNAQRRFRGEAEDRGEGAERLQGGSDTSCLPPLLSSQQPRVYRARLQTERPVRHGGRPAEVTCDKLPASQAAQLLLQTEALLLERRAGQRLANRTQLQEMIGRLDELVLIPP